MRMAARGATPCVIRSSTAGGVNRLSCSQLPPNTLGSMSACVMRPRPADPGEVPSGARGHNATSRHIAYAGGVAADGTTPCDTRTPQQKSALEHYVRDFVARFPGAAVVGHNELAAKACPSFDVQAWLRETGIL